MLLVMLVVFHLYYNINFGFSVSFNQLPSDWKIVRRAFKKADINNEGRLPLPDFCRVLADNKIHAKDEDMYQIFSEMDSKMDGKISYDKFLSAVLAS